MVKLRPTAGWVPSVQGQGQGRGLNTMEVENSEKYVKGKKKTLMFKLNYINYAIGQIDPHILNTLTNRQIIRQN